MKLKQNYMKLKHCSLLKCFAKFDKRHENCILLPGERWTDCEKYEPNGPGQYHCIWFKSNWKCTYNPIKKSTAEILKEDLFEI